MLPLLYIILLVCLASANYSDNCKGSERCHKDMKADCETAFNRYTDSTVYAAFTSRVDGDCTAIFKCTGAYPAMTGAQLKQEFKEIYEGQDCTDCGSHSFNNGKCEATLNYCHNCFDSGQANLTLLSVLMKP